MPYIGVKCISNIKIDPVLNDRILKQYDIVSMKESLSAIPPRMCWPRILWFQITDEIGQDLSSEQTRNLLGRKYLTYKYQASNSPEAGMNVLIEGDTTDMINQIDQVVKISDSVMPAINSEDCKIRNIEVGRFTVKELKHSYKNPWIEYSIIIKKAGRSFNYDNEIEKSKLDEIKASETWIIEKIKQSQLIEK